MKKKNIYIYNNWKQNNIIKIINKSLQESKLIKN